MWNGSLEALFVILAVLVAATPIAVIYLLISNANLKERLATLEKRVLTGEQTTPVQATAAPRDLAYTASNIPQVAQKPGEHKPESAALDMPSHAAATTAQGPAEPTPEAPSQAVVFNADNVQALVTWVTKNWFYVASALSLALAGIFLVIYSVEQGLLPPAVRITAAFVFGGALVAAGEYIRRRHGDDESSSTAYLPSTFSGAGIVTLFACVLAARLLYNFIGPEMALIGMAIVGALALILGWFYGPFLAAVGVIGAMIAPFIIGGASDTPSFLLLYFFIITAVGLSIDTLRRWAWVSVISLVAGFGAGTMLMLAAGWPAPLYFTMYSTVLALIAIAIPVRKWMPDHAGTLLSLTVFSKDADIAWPEFPVRLAGGSVLAASGLILFTTFETTHADLFWTAVAMLSLLTLAILVWARKATALVDLAILPAGALVAIVASGAPLWQVSQDLGSDFQAPQMSLMASIIVAIGLLLSIAGAWRSLQNGPAQMFVALGAATLAPALAIAMEVFWHPADNLGSYAWALHAMIIGAVMVGMAERFAHADVPAHRERMSFAILSALACIAFAMIIMFSSSALTTAIALTIVAAAWLDRKFNLPLMSLYMLAGVVFVGYRLVVDPGKDWAIEAPLADMLLSHGGAVVAFAVSYVLVKAAQRQNAMILLESAVFSSLGILVSILLYRAIVSLSGVNDVDSHWAFGIGATIWIVLGMAQLHRVQIGGAFAMVRLGLGSLFVLLGGFLVLLAITVSNPLFGSYSNLILGPKIFNTLIPAYLLPALALGAGAWRLRAISKPQKMAFLGAALALTGLWLVLTIRHFWRGATGMEWPGMDQPELYSYTVALLVIGAGVFYQSLARPNAMLRKIGLVFIGLAVAKVFFLDISGLGGLIRIFSLLFLGLALAGLAWLNRWAAARTEIAPLARDE
ncbi:DUF2339 domain-containing protein [Celeribacter baekdonensis]|uniref:DUF2339 domain-containing protein n=1 Tax=Celeribacter baekdonensis TaxID=875171 RepID=A0A2R4M6X5_9RHOB|nr:DUF2339 domain-containing protein [Celeribacter baekdonensis]